MNEVSQGHVLLNGMPSIKVARPHHRKMARMLVAGILPSEISTIMGFSATHIAAIMKSPAFQVELNRLEAKADEVAIDIRRDLEVLSEDAVEALSEDVGMEVKDRFDRKLRQDAAKDILDRTGYRKAGEPSRHAHLHLHKEAKELSDDDLRDSVFDLLKEG